MTQLKTPSTPQEIPVMTTEDEPYVPVQEQAPQYYYQMPIQDKQSDSIDRNIMIMIFVAFIAGLLLGKIMNPVILRQ